MQEHLRDKHSQTLLPLVSEVLNQAGETRAGLTHIAAGIGPGSFTGVRTAVSVAQGLALGLGLPLFGVGGLDALALGAAVKQPVRVLTALDARMHEVYAAFFTVDPARTEVISLKAPAVMHPAQLREWLDLNPDVCVGNAFAAYPADLAGFTAPVCDAVPNALHIARLALAQIGQNRDGVIHECQPQYVRNRVAATIAERQQQRQPA